MFLSADDQCRGKITTEICLYIHAQYPLSRGPSVLSRSKHVSLQGSLQINFDQIIFFGSIKVSLYGS